MAKNFMKAAVKHPGALTRKAKKAGMSTPAFARKHDTGGSTTAKQSRLAEIFNKYRPGKKMGGPHKIGPSAKLRGRFGV